MNNKKTITWITIPLFIIVLSTGYTAPAGNNIDSTLQTGYTAPAGDNIDSIFGSDETPAGVTCHFTSTTTITNEVRDCSGKQVNVTGDITLNLVNSTLKYKDLSISNDAEINIDTDSELN